jgi:hypothetical protein
MVHGPVYTMPKTPRLPCLHRYCPLTFKSQHGRTYHIRSVHAASNFNLINIDNGEVSANDKANGDAVDVANAGDCDEALTQAQATSPSMTGRASGQRIEHSCLTGKFSPTVLGTLNSPSCAMTSSPM